MLLCFNGRMDCTENPFTVNGVLSQKADYIISHSTITRTEIHIADPDTIQPEVSQPEQQPSESTAEDENIAENDGGAEEVVPLVKTQPMESAAIPVENSVPSTPKNKEPPKKQVTGIVEPIEAEVRRADIAEPQRAEEVRLKKKKRCCSIV